MALPYSVGSLLKSKIRKSLLPSVTLAGKRFTGPEAYASGLVDSVAPDGEVEDVAVALA